MSCQSVSRINIEVGMGDKFRRSRTKGETMLYYLSKRLEIQNDKEEELMLNIERLKGKNLELLDAQQLIIKQKMIIRSLKRELRNELNKTIEDDTLSSWSDDSLPEESHWT